MRSRSGESTWRGDAELKRAILAQLAGHRAAPVPRFEPLEVGGRAIRVFGWDGTPARRDLAAEALGLPHDLLELGWTLFETFPDCDEGVAEEIGLKMDFLARIPVGVDAARVVTRFVAGCLADRSGGLGAPTGAADRALIAAVAGAVGRESEGELGVLGERVAARLAELEAELRVACQDPQSAECLRTRREVWAMEATAAACRVLDDPRAAVRVAEGALEGRRGADWDLDKDFERLGARLLVLLEGLG